MFSELFYWTYKTLSQVKSNKTPAFNSYVLISVFEGFNLGTLWGILNYFLKVNVDKGTAVYLGLIFSVGLFFMNYFLLYSKRECIFHRYDQALSQRKVKGRIFFWLYVVLTFVLFAIVAEYLVTPHY